MSNVIKIFNQLQDVFLVVRVFGNGRKKIITFHGYGQSGEVFEQYTTHHPAYTVYAFDLFYHGNSSSPDPEIPFTHDAFYQIFDQLLQQENISKFDLMGFSMGGKFVLSLAKRYYNSIDVIYLIAPDGIRINFWYHLATRFILPKRIFKYVVNHPGVIFMLIHFVNHLGILNKMVSKFALNQMNSTSRRKRVYNSWVLLRHFFVDKKGLAEILNQKQIPVHFVLGKYDRVIKSRDIIPLMKLLKYKDLEIIEAGHTNLLQKYLVS